MATLPEADGPWAKDANRANFDPNEIGGVRNRRYGIAAIALAEPAHLHPAVRTRVLLGRAGNPGLLGRCSAHRKGRPLNSQMRAQKGTS